MVFGSHGFSATGECQGRWNPYLAQIMQHVSQSQWYTLCQFLATQESYATSWSQNWTVKFAPRVLVSLNHKTPKTSGRGSTVFRTSLYPASFFSSITVVSLSHRCSMITCKASSFKFESNPSHQIALKTYLPSLQAKYPSRKSIVVSCSYSIEGNKWNSKATHIRKTRIRAKKAQKEEQEEGERKVQCEVEVISWRERRIKAQILVFADIQSVWNALTDYERLADFIPNLVCSGRIPCPHPGRMWLEQRGLQRALYWHIEARVVLDLQEFPHSANNRELHFSMVDGDFKKFEGKWSVKSGTRHGTTILSYEVNVMPRYNFPAIFLERIIGSDLPINLRALACRAEKDFERNNETEIADSEISMTSPSSPGMVLDGAFCDKDKLSTGDLKESYPGSAFGPMQPPSSDLNSNWGVLGKACSLDRRCMVDEVHLRRFDGLLENGGVHRCVVASITVKAPVREVWNVLTAYESLPEFVPNLAISKVLSRENNKVRILQEGCKGLLYMVLHARVVLDLCEYLEQEISFEQVEGDFDSFQGKWILEQLGSHHTLLKYNVESKMHKDTFLSEAIMEEVIYEDLPSNLCAIRDYIEKREAKNSLETGEEGQNSKEIDLTSSDCDNEHAVAVQQVSNLNDFNSLKQRPRVPGLQRDIEVLKSELLKFISEHGQEGFMPMRKQLRLHGRVDIEKAITRMGGFRRIATLMNLSLAYKHRKPKGFWDNLENLQEEISRFQRNWGMDPSFMPSRKSFERAGRYDIARALEKWGGLHEVSRLLALKVRHPNRQANVHKDKNIDNVPSSPNVEEGEAKIQSKAYVSQDTKKWLLKYKDLDIDWVD